jgi:hypothetical protein
MKGREGTRNVDDTYLFNDHELIDIMLLLCSCSQHADEKYDKAPSTEEIPDSPMTVLDSDYCISVYEAKTIQPSAGTKIIRPEMSDELAVVERTAIVVSTIARSPANSLTLTLRAASADSSLSQENNQMMKGLHRLRLFCGAIVNHPWVQQFIIFLTVVNAVMLGVATYDFVKESSTLNLAFETTDMIILIIFTVELVMQLLFHGHTFIKDGWLVFDFVIVIVSWSAASLQALRIVRVLKLVS